MAATQRQSPYGNLTGGQPTQQATDDAGTAGHTSSNSRYAGPAGYLYDLQDGKAGSFTDYLDPGDFFHSQSSADALAAGKEAASYLAQLSQTAWDRQMVGLQKALSSMNNYSGILSHMTGTPGAQNYYDPNGFGGTLGQDPRMAGRPMPPPAAPPPVGSTGPATESRYGRGHF